MLKFVGEKSRLRNILLLRHLSLNFGFIAPFGERFMGELRQGCLINLDLPHCSRKVTGPRTPVIVATFSFKVGKPTIPLQAARVRSL